jgi:hypothetical protein
MLAIGVIASPTFGKKTAEQGSDCYHKKAALL